MSFLRPIPRRLLPDDMIVWPAVGDGTFGSSRIVRHVRMDWEQAVVDDGHRGADGGRGTVFVDACNSLGCIEIPVGSRVLVGKGPSLHVRKVKRCCVVRGHVHHWELEVG